MKQHDTTQHEMTQLAYSRQETTRHYIKQEATQHEITQHKMMRHKRTFMLMIGHPNLQKTIHTFKCSNNFDYLKNVRM